MTTPLNSRPPTPRGIGSPMTVRIRRVRFMVPKWAGAQVLGPSTIRVRQGVPLTARLLAHEMVHIFQYHHRGTLAMWMQYLIGMLKAGYDSHPLEDIAYKVEGTPRALEYATAMLNRLPDHERGGHITLKQAEYDYFSHVSRS